MNTLETNFIDLRPLIEEVEGNMTICKKLIESFLKDIHVYMNTVNEELKTNNWLALYPVVHKIIPSIRIFNVITLEPILIQLETNLKNLNNLEDINIGLNTSLIIFNQVKHELHNELKLIDNATI